MTPEIQELKRLAEAAKKVTLQSPDDRALYDFDRATTPDTILALIEIAEAAEAVNRQFAWGDFPEGRRLRTALEGVKK